MHDPLWTLYERVRAHGLFLLADEDGALALEDIKRNIYGRDMFFELFTRLQRDVHDLCILTVKELAYDHLVGGLRHRRFIYLHDVHNHSPLHSLDLDTIKCTCFYALVAQDAVLGFDFYRTVLLDDGIRGAYLDTFLAFRAARLIDRGGEESA